MSRTGHYLRGERARSAVLTAADVRQIRRQLSYGATLQTLATAYGISRQNVWLIKQGRIWQHVKDA